LWGTEQFFIAPAPILSPATHAATTARPVRCE
jgi:hypothetical protein